MFFFLIKLWIHGRTILQIKFNIFSQIDFAWIDMYNILKVFKCEIQGLHKCFGFVNVILVILII
jgi:hypothetical protein